MRTIKIHLDDRAHSQKPDKKETALISQRITEKETEIDVTAFAKEVGENGRTFTPALFHGGRKKENFMRQQAFALDFDGGIGLDEFLSRAERHKALPAFVYETFSGSEDSPRFRAVFINDCVVEEERVSFIITKLLFQIFPESDKCCSDVTRMFFGGKGILYGNMDAEVNLKDLAVSAQEKMQREDGHNYARNVNALGRVLGVRVRNNSLCIHSSIELGENEENRIATGIIRVNIQNSSKSYVIEKRADEKTDKYAKSIRFDEGFQAMQNKSCKEIANACPLFRDFYQSDLHHSLKFCLATNLRFIKGGRKFFFDGLKDGHERWKTQWKYIKAHGYRPMRCKAAGCPYADQCRCASLYDKLGRKIQKTTDQENYIPLEEAVGILHEALERALRSRSGGIHLIKAQTAIGKTTAYCKMARYRIEGKPLMIALPTNMLQDQVHSRLRASGVQSYKTLNIINLLEDAGLESLKAEVEDLYSKGFGNRVKKVIGKHFRENKEFMNVIHRLDFEKYLKSQETLDGSECVVTTHAMLLCLPENVLKKYEVIVDEDILMTIFKGTASISFQEIGALLKKGGLSTYTADKLHEMLAMEDETVGHTGLCGLDIQGLEELYEKSLPIQSSAPDFLSSSTFYVDAQAERIHYFNAKKIPNVKLTVVSASANEKLYRDYCKGQSIHYAEVPLSAYKGKLEQRTAHSMSRSCIQNIGLDKVRESIKRVTGECGAKWITFKMFSGQAAIYFGKTEGFNDYEGRDMVVLGTPHNVPFVYQLIGAHLGYGTGGRMSVSTAEHNGYSFQIMTYKDRDMRNLQFYFLESELEQAIGRARLLRRPCTVYLFSNFPCRQAEIIQDDYILW